MKRETRLMRRRTELMFQVVTARGIFLSSCPAACRASTSCVHRVFKDVDGRDKPGHDEVPTRSPLRGVRPPRWAGALLHRLDVRVLDDLGPARDLVRHEGA